jgi:hypothetical protein
MRQPADGPCLEDSEVRARMADVLRAFEILESELKQHIERLQIKRWERTAAALGLLSPLSPKAAAY